MLREADRRPLQRPISLDLFPVGYRPEGRDTGEAMGDQHPLTSHAGPGNCVGQHGGHASTFRE